MKFLFQKTRLFICVLSLKSIMKQNFVNFKIQKFFIVNMYMMNMKMEKRIISHQHSLTCATVSLFFDEYESNVGEINEGNQPIQYVVVHCHKTSDVHVLFQGNQVDYGLTNTWGVWPRRQKIVSLKYHRGKFLLHTHIDQGFLLKEGTRQTREDTQNWKGGSQAARHVDCFD
jgi:hypothetical protein